MTFVKKNVLIQFLLFFLFPFRCAASAQSGWHQLNRHQVDDSKTNWSWLQIECADTIRAVMDSRIGLDYIVENREYVAKLASALDTANSTVKKQVFELLSALCVYNADGYSRTLDALEHFKNLKGMPTSFHNVSTCLPLFLLLLLLNFPSYSWFVLVHHQNCSCSWLVQVDETG